MKIPRSPALALAMGMVAAGALGLAACAYDWSVGPAQPAEGGAPDAAADSPLADATPSADVDAGPPPLEAAADAPAEAASPPSCADLTSELSSARRLAKVCDSPASGECASFVTDECQCDSYVAVLDAGSTNAYVTAIAAFLDAGCVPSCSDSGCSSVLVSCEPALSGGGYTCR